MSHDTLIQELLGRGLVSRIFDRDTSVFAPPGATEAHANVRSRLGWLTAPAEMRARLGEVETVVDAARKAWLTDVYLLGMGGSSLCAEVLRDVATAPRGGAAIVMVDTTDERAIRRVTDRLVPKRSLFIVASKSGSTIEITSLERHFHAIMEAACPAEAGSHFIAITDPDTALVAHASTCGYRHTFINPADIGGRYSALSLFGLVPASLLGLDLRALLDSALRMASRCRSEEATNPGVALGAFMGGHALEGCDKLTLVVPASLAPLGAWVEQLVAESTGKHGRGVLPVVGEPAGDPAEYGSDRAFVAILTPDSSDERKHAGRLEAAGHPVYRIETSVGDLGGEFFRWEFATAVAGAVLEVNPFDEPNVRDAKARTQAQLDARHATGVFRIDPAFTRGPGYSRREHRPDPSTSGSARSRYLAILDYLPAEPRRAVLMERLRQGVRRRSRVATTHGLGPRYLHSTGQYHKGGPNSGMFLLLTAADASATPIPGADYTFSTLKQAQAIGDFDALVAAGREVVHYHFEDPTADLSVDLEKVVSGLR